MTFLWEAYFIIMTFFWKAYFIIMTLPWKHISLFPKEDTTRLPYKKAYRLLKEDTYWDSQKNTSKFP
jgi:hypothetical protein